MNDVASITAELHDGHETCGAYIYKLYQEGVLGPGKKIDSAPLPMEKWGTAAFTKALCQAIVSREGIGADLAEGLMRASKKWGRLEQDLASGLLDKSEWGYGWHWDLPTVERVYGSLLDSRDTNETFQMTMGFRTMGENELPAEKVVEILSKKVIPYNDDPFMFDYTWQGADGSNMKQALDTGIYSRHKAKLVAWHRHFTRFWGVSMLACFTMFPKFLDAHAPDFVGPSPEFETRFYKAVTGQNLSFADSMEIGRKIWNLNRAIWVLQGRHRDIENYAEFMYTPAGSLLAHVKEHLPRENRAVIVYKNGRWIYTTQEDMYLDKAGLEQWKTHYYEVEGWDPANGWPTRKTLEELGLKKVADTLEKANKLGSPS
jgi:aldehyde:ferredoxin oxidoreductase